MTHAKLHLGMACAGIIAIVACASMDSSESGSPSKGADGGNGDERAAAPGASTDQPSASGVVLVHGAAFPSFRLCFENLPNLQPQPDSKIMPEANAVGVEIGSVIRIDPLVAPGKVYVLDERVVRRAVGETTPTCGELVSPTSPRRLAENNNFHVIAEPIIQPLGNGRVQLLGITGCGNQAFLDFIKAPSSSCGAGWDPVRGNLKARVVDVPATSRSGQTVPVQVFPMSSALEAFRKDATLSVSFGKLADSALGTKLDPGAAYVGGPLSQIAFDQTDTAIYGTHGFRVEVAPPSAFRMDQTLAAVQELSAPNDLPTTYYRAASSYALVLLGDPAHQPQLPDGGANADYSARRAVHFVAVPVLEPSAADAGADGGDASAR